MAPCANSEIAAVSQIGHVLSCWIEQIKIRDAHLNLNVRHIFSCKGHFFVIIMRNARLREGGRTPGRGGGLNPISWPPREAGGRPYDGFTPVRISLENPQPSARLLRRGACGWPSKEGGSGGPEHGQRPFTEHPSAEAPCPSPPPPEGLSPSGYHAWQTSLRKRFLSLSWERRSVEKIYVTSVSSAETDGDQEGSPLLCAILLLGGRTVRSPGNGAPMSMTVHALLNPSMR